MFNPRTAHQIVKKSLAPRCRALAGASGFAKAGFGQVPVNIVSPHRLARSRTPAFHAGDTGSNPVGDAKQNQGVSLYG